MAFRMKPIASGLCAAFGSVAAAVFVAVPAHAQQQPQQPQQLERVEITGSNIRRADAETTQPVIILRKEDIEKSGRTTVSDLLQALPIVSQGSFSEATGAGNSFAPGTASVSIRGLGVNTVLVLLNGRRLANYGFAQNLNEAFVDLNAIPITAIERIEVLKDGASAIYGSDAIAGVVNIILRKDFRGYEVSATAGTTKEGGGTEYRASVAAGFGNLASDRYNAMLTLDYYTRERINSQDREFSKTANQEPRGGFDQRSPTGNPGTWLNLTTGQATAFANCPADRIIADPSLPGTNCSYDFAADNDLIPKTERVGLFARGVFDFTQNLSAFAEAGFTKNVTNQSAAPTPGTFTATTNPANPFPGNTVLARFRLTDVGPRLNEIEQENRRLVLGLQGSAGTFNWEVAGNYSKSEVTNTGTNYVDQQAADGVITGTGVCARDPATGQRIGTTVGGVFTCTQFTVAPGQFLNLSNPGARQDLLGAIRVTPVRQGETELKSVDAKGSLDLFSLPGGMTAMAFGLERRSESLKDTPDPLSRLNVIVGSGGTSSQGERDVNVGYVELSAPFAPKWESQLAVRLDDYSDFGNEVTWKAAAGFRPTSGTLIRGGVATGFRAPALVELYLGESISFPNQRDVQRCNAYTAAFGVADPRTVSACGTPQVRTSFLGNPRLDPEKSQSYSFGILLEPIRNLSIGLDYFNIFHKNRITSPTGAFILGNPNLYQTCVIPTGGTPAPGCVINRNPQNANDILANAPGSLLGIGGGNVSGINRSFFNSTFQKVWGWDADIRYNTTIGTLGRFGFQNALTYLGSFRQQVNPGQANFEFVDTAEYPRVRNVSTLTWLRGPWDTTFRVNYIGSYDQFYQVTYERVRSWTTADLNVTYSGVKNLRLSVGGTNIFDRDPPFYDLDWFGYDANTHSARGAFWYLSGTYRF